MAQRTFDHDRGKFPSFAAHVVELEAPLSIGMDSIGDSPGPDVLLHGLILRFEEICLGTRGRLRRLNRYLMGCDLILSVMPAHLRADAELRLTQIALCCGLLDMPGRLPMDRPASSPMPSPASPAGLEACPGNPCPA